MNDSRERAQGYTNESGETPPHKDVFVTLKATAAQDRQYVYTYVCHIYICIFNIFKYKHRHMPYVHTVRVHIYRHVYMCISIYIYKSVYSDIGYPDIGSGFC